jgi:AraC-like DNA-binding protein
MPQAGRARGSDLLLDRFRIFQSKDLGEIRRFFRNLAAVEVKNARLIDGGHGFRCNAVTSDQLSIFSLSSDISGNFDLEGLGFLRLVFQTRRHSRVIIAKREFEVGPSDAGYFLPAGLPAIAMHPDGCRSLSIRIDPAIIRRRLSALCGEDISGAIEFEQPRKGDERFIEFIRRPLFAAARELEIVGAEFQEHLMSDLASVTVTRLLLFGTHNHARLLESNEGAPSRSQMERAEAFIASNWNKAIDVEGIAEASGVSARTMLRYFHEKHGMTPRAYLRAIRLERARQMLVSARDGDTVVGIALKCGFNSLGHFAESYRRQFGELPSATLRERS